MCRSKLICAAADVASPGAAGRTDAALRAIRRRRGYQAEGAGGGTTGGRSSQVIVFGSSHGANHGPVVPPPSLPLPKSENSEPAAVKWNEPQLFTPTAPTLRASTLRMAGASAERAGSEAAQNKPTTSNRARVR